MVAIAAATGDALALSAVPLRCLLTPQRDVATLVLGVEVNPSTELMPVADTRIVRAVHEVPRFGNGVPPRAVPPRWTNGVQAPDAVQRW